MRLPWRRGTEKETIILNGAYVNTISSPHFSTYFTTVQYWAEQARYTLDGRKDLYAALAEVKDYVPQGAVIIPGKCEVMPGPRVLRKPATPHPLCGAKHDTTPEYVDTTYVMVRMFKGVHPKHVKQVLTLGADGRSSISCLRETSDSYTVFYGHA